MLGNGDGTFHDGAEYSVDAVGTSAGIATGKFTSRGNLDVAALGSAGIVTVFVRVTVCAELLAPTNWSGKRIGKVGEKQTTPVLSKVMTESSTYSATAKSGGDRH